MTTDRKRAQSRRPSQPPKRSSPSRSVAGGSPTAALPVASSTTTASFAVNDGDGASRHERVAVAGTAEVGAVVARREGVLRQGRGHTAGRIDQVESEVRASVVGDEAGAEADQLAVRTPGEHGLGIDGDRDIADAGVRSAQVGSPRAPPGWVMIEPSGWNRSTGAVELAQDRAVAPGGIESICVSRPVARSSATSFSQYSASPPVP